MAALQGLQLKAKRFCSLIEVEEVLELLKDEGPAMVILLLHEVVCHRCMYANKVFLLLYNLL